MATDLTTITFYGSSDDLIEVDGNLPGCDEYNGEHAEFTVAGLRVFIDYVTPGVWRMGVAQIDEDVPIIARAIRVLAPESRQRYMERISHNEGPFYPPYSMILQLDVPTNSEVVYRAKEGS